jgi:histidine triad (HIT) family protein
MGTECVFCDILAGRTPATIVAETSGVVALVDVRQFHPGHVIVIPRDHVSDIREANDMMSAALMRMVARVARAITVVCPLDGLSIWHSIGEGANQEVPHLHFHVHPRRIGDDMLRVYPSSPECPDREALNSLGAVLREAIANDDA